MSKRLALLGAQSTLSIARPRGLCSSYGLIDSRPFPYRQISDLSKNSQMETTQDLKLSILISELKTSQEHHYTLVKREIQKLRHDMEIMQIEQRNFKLNYKSELGTVAWSSAPIGILFILMLYK